MGAGIAAPRLLFAQDAKLVTVAVLFIGDSDDDELAAKPFFDAMTRFGWTEGKNINYDRHSGKGTRQYLDTMVSNAADAEPNLIFATTASLATAVMKEAKAVPVVFATMADPVAANLVTSLAKPGGNATGVYQIPGHADVKRYKLVRELLPSLTRLGIVFDRSNPDLEGRKAEHAKAAAAAGFELSVAEITNFEAIAKVLAQFKRDKIVAAMMTPSFALTGRRREVGSLAERNGVALIAHRSEWADAGAVLTYGVDTGEGYRRAAAIVNRILKGAKPAEIAVDLPNRFELVANQRAGIALGIAVPKTILKRASRVIT
jgi:putative tryptophan/tyrosine transport system substrate-binding protein